MAWPVCRAQTLLTGLMNLRPDLELAIRELYGYSVIFGVFVLMLIAASRFKKQIYSILPQMQRIWRRLPTVSNLSGK